MCKTNNSLLIVPFGKKVLINVHSPSKDSSTLSRAFVENAETGVITLTVASNYRLAFHDN